ncbi:MAG TPA: CopG family transcriptional regulator [Chloroflexota bacterium]|jgi:Arc/MetJ-type ribon-helix-helix transcriptional regulator
MTSKPTRITITLPADLLAAADRAVAEGAARSRNDLLVRALRDLLAARERAALDADFARMSTDADYLAESVALARDFDPVSWEVFQQAETRMG